MTRICRPLGSIAPPVFVLVILIFSFCLGAASVSVAKPRDVTVGSFGVKGIVIDPIFTAFRRSNTLPLGILARTGFTVIGTIADFEFRETEWNNLESWVKSVHDGGFLSLVDVSGDRHNFASEVAMATRLAKMHVDIVSLDEPISMYKLDQQELQSGIQLILLANPKQQILITDYNQTAIQNAYAWTKNYSTVRIGTDEYDAKNVIDFGIQEASRYGKRPTVWLIFEQGSQNFDCYLHLDQWLAYVEKKPVDVYFWYVDRAGTFQAEWESVARFRTGLVTFDRLQYPVDISPNASDPFRILVVCALSQSSLQRLASILGLGNSRRL